MTKDYLKNCYDSYKELRLKHRYINNDHILPLIENLKDHFEINQIGDSVLKAPIHSIKIGNGTKKILIWSQMHGNESTSTKAIFDLCNVFSLDDSDNIQQILNSCTILIIPILNPDGAKAFTRLNANGIDLNRDAKSLTQPESIVLRNLFNDFKPHFCFNLHGQRTFFAAGEVNKSATLSFLSPAVDEGCMLNDTRKKAMEVIVAINNLLQAQIPKQIGVYDDTFNDNCVGDTFQVLEVPTLLFEAGHYKNDYAREITRFYMFQALMYGLYYIAINKVSGSEYKLYFDIPMNSKSYFDIIIRQAKIPDSNEVIIRDIAIQYQEVLKNNSIDFVPKIEKIGDLSSYFGHKEISAHSNMVSVKSNQDLIEGLEVDEIFIENTKYSLKLTQS